MKVIKIGGGCFKNQEAAQDIVELIAQRGRGDIFVLSAFSGITDLLLSGIDLALEDEEEIFPVVAELSKRHLAFARRLIVTDAELAGQEEIILSTIKKIERYYFGINFTREATPRMRNILASYGERLSASIVTAALNSRGRTALCLFPHKVGIITDGKYSDATARLKKTAENLAPAVTGPAANGDIIFMPGFYGISEAGEITTFGRGGSDYSAAVVAAAVRADLLEIWKDTEGFMTADPDNIDRPKLIPRLNYMEAAELAYTGAGILHPRTIEPVRKAKIDIAIKNTYNPDARGSLITRAGRRTRSVIKSVSYTRDIAVLKIHASGIGARPGILSTITESLASRSINIKSVITSQTCIGLLLAEKDIDPAQGAIQKIKPRPYRRTEKNRTVALVSIVGEGLHHCKGIAAKCFTAVSGADVNIEMISFGPSNAALYFLVNEDDLDKTITALHAIFFETAP
ncbi:MAG: aspartate kinase [Desulfobacteraceae bacterium]